MSNFIAIDGQKMVLTPNSHPNANLSAPSPTHDSVFVQLKLSVEAGPVDLKCTLPYYDLGTQSPGSAAVNFKVEHAHFDAIAQTITLHLRTNKTIAAEINTALTKVLNSGAKAQLSVEIAAANDKQTVDQANKGTIVQYFDPQSAKFTMCEEKTRQFQSVIAHECGDSYLRTPAQNETELTGIIVVTGKWEKGTPISTWTGDSTQKIVVGVDAGGK
ncbi:hypothetical protein IBE20_04480 [Francisella tularensis subsp. novicida]|uniref:Uncharacterized protein n=2 Tax=Francisella tularensis TaxID=263 RepID=A0A6I4RUA5_FRATU|nr:hypothetical protein [Francisella tularensis]ABK88955.1 protein of unknown function [Francisella tularensis subsp. novicida U112]AJI60314.1 hypothetical protein AW25_156 [Francisella tularensis subsp. novicida U112]EDX19348.1 hypothetical protein FTE_0336 [Francisella tularensis subsp. novicida FTE]MBK2036011.1 hypothetical protein [Francisella tularensis subsp. novicida]MBK2115937.1 hypothetical protein [Francisella tularensis subsp. novicida]